MNKKNRILIIGSSHPSSLETMYYKAFKHLEFENIVLKNFQFPFKRNLKIFITISLCHKKLISKFFIIISWSML
jgi:hypothetical protein